MLAGRGVHFLCFFGFPALCRPGRVNIYIYILFFAKGTIRKLMKKCWHFFGLWVFPSLININYMNETYLRVYDELFHIWHILLYIYIYIKRFNLYMEGRNLFF